MEKELTEDCAKDVTMRILALCFILAAAFAPVQPARSDGLPPMTVWKTPWCGCCANWVAHMRESGFAVTVHDVEKIGAIKRAAGVSKRLGSCHTAKVGGYVVEGHVPAADVKRLITLRPEARGLAAPGMPAGSPGMEVGRRDAYDVLLFRADGGAKVFSSHNRR